tara:strand:+ start:400 stop:786 length:387 start_codon:yes stop_codon:yes gene_type:complete
LDLERKSKIFSRLALKEKMTLLKKIKTLSTLSTELQQTANLYEKLSELISDDTMKDLPQNAFQLKAKKFYSQKIHDELNRVSNRKFFLEKEASDVRLSAGKTKTKVNKALEKSATYNQLYQIELENKS